MSDVYNMISRPISWKEIEFQDQERSHKSSIRKLRVNHRWWYSIIIAGSRRKSILRE
jgi:hypothetical protein